MAQSYKTCWTRERREKLFGDRKYMVLQQKSGMLLLDAIHTACQLMTEAELTEFKRKFKPYALHKDGWKDYNWHDVIVFIDMEQRDFVNRFYAFVTGLKGIR